VCGLGGGDVGAETSMDVGAAAAVRYTHLGVAAHAHAHAGAGGKSPDSSLQGAKRRLIRIANQCGLPVSWSIVFGCEPVRSTVHLLLALVVACVSVPTLWAPRRVSCVACGARGRGKQRARLGDVGSGATKRCRLATQGHHSHTQVLQGNQGHH